MTSATDDYNELRLAAQAAMAPEWTFADRLRKARKQAGVTQREFALMLKVKAGTLQSWEAENSQPSEGDRLLLAVRIQAIGAAPAWWMVGQSAPHDLLNDETAAPEVRTAARELLEAERLETLPRLDSNQQPAVYRPVQVTALPLRHLRLVS